MRKVNYSQLINAMSNDIRSYRELKKVLQDKFEAIKARQPQDIEDASVRQEEILRVIATNANRRAQVVNVLTSALFPERQDRSRVTLTEIAEQAGDPDRGKLMALKSILHKEVEQVQSLNRINNLAVKKMLGHLDFIFKAIVNLENEKVLYKKDGIEDTTPSSGLIDAIA